MIVLAPVARNAYGELMYTYETLKRSARLNSNLDFEVRDAGWTRGTAKECSGGW
ncbi:predicted protein [Sclerotinia sclerotiorum 1980 UF-70]|uniref:Uncharacterized protein n=1 Tax=Sclerotinia sclerotiorum (strain ATCC 18683 / 1980 / Ss-1) TaxID=665079 RepID=A7ETT3_SCLS1|nr:predicted protein [Sclerotinia sclerotiorum 1980 UF-70]EDN92875.1 predicted protein [Sclerotinia sclerotiorum 1980 UF-70]